MRKIENDVEGKNLKLFTFKLNFFIGYFFHFFADALQRQQNIKRRESIQVGQGVYLHVTFQNSRNYETRQKFIMLSKVTNYINYNGNFKKKTQFKNSKLQNLIIICIKYQQFNLTFSFRSIENGIYIKEEFEESLGINFFQSLSA